MTGVSRPGRGVVVSGMLIRLEDDDGSMDTDDPIVLVVDDEPSLVEIYTHWLESDYRVRTAECGETALEALDDDVDIMILDRLMPGMTGCEVTDAVRKRDLDCMIVMATAVEPDFDLISMDIDTYLTKPIERDELLTTVSQMLDRQRYAELEREVCQLASKRATLVTSRNETALQASKEYDELETRIGELREQLDDRDTIDDAFLALLRDIRGKDRTRSSDA